MQPVGGDAEQQQGAEQQHHQDQLIVAGTLLVDKLLTALFVFQHQPVVVALAAGKIHLCLEGGRVFTQGAIEAAAIIGLMLLQRPIGGGVVALSGQQIGPQPLAGEVQRLGMAQQRQGLTLLALATQGLGPGGEQMPGGGVAELPIEGFCLIQSAQRRRAIALGIEGLGEITQHGGAPSRGEGRVGQLAVEQLPCLGRAAHVEIESCHARLDECLAAGFIQPQIALQGVQVVILGLLVQPNVGVEIAQCDEQLHALQLGQLALLVELTLEQEGASELGDRQLQLVGAIVRQAVQGMPLSQLCRIVLQGWLESGEQGEGLIRGRGVQGKSYLLQLEIPQPSRLLMGGGQGSGSGVVELGASVIPLGGLGQGAGMEQLHVLTRDGVELGEIAGGIAHRAPLGVLQQGWTGLDLGQPAQEQQKIAVHFRGGPGSWAPS